MSGRFKPEVRFILTDKKTGRFPKIDSSVISSRLLTDSLERTYIFDERDNVNAKVKYYNVLYKGVAEFEAFTF